MDEILKAIDSALAKKGMKDATASRLAVGHPKFLTHLRKRSSNQRLHPIEGLIRLAEALDLEFYIGPPRIGTELTEGVSDTFTSIPRYEVSLSAGNGALAGPELPASSLGFRLDWLSKRGINPEQCVIVDVAGDSMAPTLSDGDLVMIDRRVVDNLRSNALYGLVTPDGLAKVKRVTRYHDDLVLSSENPAYPPEIYHGPDAASVRIIGEVVWVGHEFKRGHVG